MYTINDKVISAKSQILFQIHMCIVKGHHSIIQATKSNLQLNVSAIIEEYTPDQYCMSIYCATLFVYCTCVYACV